MGLINANKYNQDVFIIFDLFGAPTNRIEEQLHNAEIKKTLTNYTVIGLMCDDRKSLHDTTTVGKHNQAIQQNIIGKYYQPMYCWLDKSGKLLGEPLGYSKTEKVLHFIRNHAQK